MKSSRKLWSCLLVLCMVFSYLAIPASAIKPFTTDSEPSLTIVERVEDFVSLRQGDKYTIETYKALLDENENTISYCFFLDPAGYVIIDTNAEVVEAAFESTASYEALINQDENIYYAGPLSYYTKEAFKYNNVVTQEEVPTNIVNISISEFTDTVNTASQHATYDAVVTPNYITTNKLSGTLQTYSYNTGVICGSTAAAIMLMYYRDYRDSWVVPSWHDTPTGQSLIELIRPEINGDPPQGAFCSDVVRGLNFYFRWRGIADQYSSTWTTASNSSTTYNLIKSLITSNKPVELLINDHPTYGNHFVVAHGVEKELHGSTYYYIYAGDGWGSNNVLISFRYLRQLAYIIG